MSDFFSGLLADLLGRIEGPVHFRLLLQPLVSIAFALRDGRKDARVGRPAFGWALPTDAEHRRFLLHDGWKGIMKVFVAAYVLDVVYQLVALGGLRPLQAITVAFVLAILPYVLLRGPANRVLSARPGRRARAQ